MNLEKDVLTIENITNYLLQLCTYNDIKTICPKTLPKTTKKLNEMILKYKIKTISADIFKNKSIGNILKFLLDNGYTLNNSDLSKLCNNQSITIEMLKLLISYNVEIPLHDICRNESTTYEMLELIGGDFNEQCALTGSTPLHHVCYSYTTTLEMLQFALQNGANPNIQNMKGNTPTHSECNENLFLTTIKILIQYNADFNMVNEDNDTPIHILTENYSLNTNQINLFLQNGFKLNIYNFNGDTVKKLLENGLIDITNKEMICELYTIADYDIFINISKRQLIRKYINHLEKIKNLKIYLSLILLRFTICGPVILNDIISNLFFIEVNKEVNEE
jgi:ankyrin repeat protein